MAAPLRSGLTVRQARRVGLELGVFLLAIGLFAAHRKPQLQAYLVVALAAALLGLALVRPVLLVPAASRWMRIGALLSRLVQPVVLTLIYLVVLTPVAWLRRTVGRSPIRRDLDAASYWHRRERTPPDLARSSMERPF